MDVRGKLGEHEGSVRVAQDEAEFRLPKCIHNSTDGAQLNMDYFLNISVKTSLFEGLTSFNKQSSVAPFLFLVERSSPSLVSFSF